MAKWDKTAFAKREIALGIALVEKNPTDEVQLDRVAYWALQIGDLATAEKYGTTAKMKPLVDERKLQLSV